MKTALYKAIAGAVLARENCKKSGNPKWHAKHEQRANTLCLDYMPSGSGIDSGTKIDWRKTTPEKLVFFASFHHMDEYGFYDGGTNHIVTVKPSLFHDLFITISGKNRNNVKDLLADIFDYALSQEVEEYPGEEENESNDVQENE